MEAGGAENTKRRETAGLEALQTNFRSQTRHRSEGCSDPNLKEQRRAIQSRTLALEQSGFSLFSGGRGAGNFPTIHQKGKHEEHPLRWWWWAGEGVSGGGGVRRESRANAIR